MKNKKNIVDCYILAGGKSSRMGSDKGLLPFDGQPLVQKIIEQLSPIINEIIIVSNNREYEKFGLKVIEDLIVDKGPAGGIHAALSNAKTEQIFVVSCDMPFITPEAVTYMVQQASQSQITLPLYDGRIQPLFGVYSRQCLPKWTMLIKQGIIKLQAMILHFDLLKVNIENNDLFEESLFTNINDRNDFNKALNQL